MMFVPSIGGISHHFTENTHDADIVLGCQVFADAAQLRDRVQAIAASIAAKSPLTVRGIKQILNYGRDHSLADGLDYVATWNSAMLLSDDTREAIAAAMQKRPPRFKD